MVIERKSEMEESLIVMDLADRLRRHDQQMSTVTDLDTSRDAIKSRIQSFYSAQGHNVDDRIIDQAIEQRLSRRLVHQPIVGGQRQVADLVLATSKSSLRVVMMCAAAGAGLVAIGLASMSALLLLL